MALSGYAMRNGVDAKVSQSNAGVNEFRCGMYSSVFITKLESRATDTGTPGYDASVLCSRF